MKSFFNFKNNILLEFTEQTILKIIAKFKEEASENDIRFYLDKFERYKNKLNIKDPFQYKTFTELEQTVDKVERETNERNAIVRNKKPVSNEKSDVDQEDIVVDNNDVTIYKGDSQDKCVIYGAGYSFCISRQSGGNMFTNYRLGKESTFYFIYFKKKPKTANDHIMVLDHTKNGYEWTFKDNDTQPVKGGWNEIVEKYPELAPYENLLVNKKLDEDEKQFISILKEFSNNPSLDKFNDFSYKQKTQALKTVVDLPDSIFKTLDSFLINEFISIGPNLTDYQASSLNPTQVKRYQVKRAISLPQMDESKYLIKFNILDSSPEILDFISQNRNWSLDYYFNINKDSGNSIIEKFGKAHETVVNNFGKVVRENGYSNVDFYNKGFYILPDLSDLEIKGDFDCSGNKLNSLKGAPKSVGVSFNCSYNKLKSLHGAPESVGVDFYCNNNSLNSLEGSPKSVGRDFNSSENSLNSLEGSPKSVGGGFSCQSNKLTSLYGAPESVGGSFNCSYNNLNSLEGSPKSVEKGYFCSYNNLNSLKGAPDSVEGSFDCQSNKLTSLEGAPKSVGGSFICIYNSDLNSLKGSPKSIGRNFQASINSLNSLEGAPDSIGGDFVLRIGKLNSLKGISPFIKGTIFVSNFSQKEINDAMENSRKEWQLSSESFKYFFYNKYI